MQPSLAAGPTDPSDSRRDGPASRKGPPVLPFRVPKASSGCLAAARGRGRRPVPRPPPVAGRREGRGGAHDPHERRVPSGAGELFAQRTWWLWRGRVAVCGTKRTGSLAPRHAQPPATPDVCWTGHPRSPRPLPPGQVVRTTCPSPRPAQVRGVSTHGVWQSHRGRGQVDRPSLGQHHLCSDACVCTHTNTRPRNVLGHHVRGTRSAAAPSHSVGVNIVWLKKMCTAGEKG